MEWLILGVIILLTVIQRPDRVRPFDHHHSISSLEGNRVAQRRPPKSFFRGVEFSVTRDSALHLGRRSDGDFGHLAAAGEPSQ